eukprot:gene18458-biopygen6916
MDVGPRHWTRHGRAPGRAPGRSGCRPWSSGSWPWSSGDSSPLGTSTRTYTPSVPLPGPRTASIATGCDVHLNRAAVAFFGTHWWGHWHGNALALQTHGNALRH